MSDIQDSFPGNSSQKEVFEDIHRDINRIIKGCGELKGELAVKCFSLTKEFEDDITESFKEELVDNSKSSKVYVRGDYYGR